MFNKIEELINNYKDEDGEDYADLGNNFMKTEVDYMKPVLEGFTYKSVDNYGGEDQGSDFWSVYEFTETATGNTCLIKFYGYYASHYGTDYLGMKEVKGKARTITVYE